MKRPEIKKAKQQVTNEDVILLHRNLVNIKGVKGAKLIYAIGRTLAMLEPVVESMGADKCIPVTDEFKELQEKRRELAKKYAKGKTRTQGNMQMYDLPWDRPGKEGLEEFEKYSKELEALNKKYEAAIKEREKDEKEYGEYLKEPFEENLDSFIHKVTVDTLEKSEIPEDFKFVVKYIVEA